MLRNHNPIDFSYRDGCWRAFPIAITYLSIGIACGVVGIEYGLSPLEITLLSLIVFAGSAQFAFAPLYGGSLVSLVATIFYINIRHLVYSMSLSLRAKKLKMPAKVLIGLQLTDETFLVASTALQDQQIEQARWMISINMVAHTSWVIGNVVGATSTQFLDYSLFGVDFAPTGMFLCLLLLQLGKSERGRQALLVAVFAASAAFVAHFVKLGHLAFVIIAPMIALVCAVLFGSSVEDRELALTEEEYHHTS